MKLLGRKRQGCKICSQSGLDSFQMGQIWDFFRSVSGHFGSPKLIFRKSDFISFVANLTQFGSNPKKTFYNSYKYPFSYFQNRGEGHRPTPMCILALISLCRLLPVALYYSTRYVKWTSLARTRGGREVTPGQGVLSWPLTYSRPNQFLMSRAWTISTSRVNS